MKYKFSKHKNIFLNINCFIRNFGKIVLLKNLEILEILEIFKNCFIKNFGKFFVKTIIKLFSIFLSAFLLVQVFKR